MSILHVNGQRPTFRHRAEDSLELMRCDAVDSFDICFTQLLQT